MQRAIASQQLIIQHTMLKALLNWKGGAASLMRFLSPAIQQKVSSLSLSPSISFTNVLDQKKWLPSIHYSWFVPFLKKLPLEIVANYLPLFTAPEQKILSQLFNCSKTAPPLNAFGTLILLSHLKKAIGADSVLPIELLPPSPFIAVLDLPENKLLYLIDFLGLHDLAAETKQIVDKQVIARIHTNLTEQERSFLSYCSKQPMRYVPPKLNLQAWDGKSESLHNLLHARGIVRLAKATIGEQPTFCWYLAHSFDMNRGKVLIEAYKDPVEKSLLPYFQKQVFELLERLK